MSGLKAGGDRNMKDQIEVVEVWRARILKMTTGSEAWSTHGQVQGNLSGIYKEEPSLDN